MRFSGALPAISADARASRLMASLLMLVAFAYLGLFLVVPVVAVFAKALEKGLEVYWAAISDPMTLAAVHLTVIAAAIAVPLNTLFGLAASWAIAKFDFPGRNLL